MKLVRPVAVTVDSLTSDVPQPEGLWAIGTNYGAAAAVYEVIDAVPMRFTSKVGGNIGHRPSEDEAQDFWKPEGATNRWAMFDGTIQTQTVQADTITVTFQLAPDQSIDTLRLQNVSCATVQVVVTGPDAEDLFDVTYDMTSTLGIDDYLPWFTEPIVRRRGLTVEDLPAVLYPGSTIEVTLSDPGADVAAGLCLFGHSRELGGTKWGTEISFRDLSIKEEDPFGGLFIAKRTFKRQASFDVNVKAGFVDELQRLMEEYRAEPVLFIGNPDYDTQAIYGFLKSFRTLINWPDQSLSTLQVESLA